jgi:hypothetical protein
VAESDGVAVLVAVLEAVQPLVRSVVGEGPVDASAPRQVDPDGVPAPPLPSELRERKSSDAEDGRVPQLVPRLASVGTPGETSAVEHVDAYVGSSAEPTPASEPAKEPRPIAIAFARSREFDVDTLVRLASASAVGPEVVGVGVDPSGAAGCGCDADADVGTVARVPGPLAEVELLEGAVEPVVLALDAVIGSLDETVAGPAAPGVTDADPPAVDRCGSGAMFGCADTEGGSASAGLAQTKRSAKTAMSSRSFLIF